MLYGIFAIKFAKRFCYNANYDRAVFKKINLREGDFGYG